MSMFRHMNDSYFTLTAVNAIVNYVLCQNMALYPSVVSKSYHAY